MFPLASFLLAIFCLSTTTTTTTTATGLSIIKDANLTTISYPFVECAGSTDDLVIDSLNLIPNPPKKGSKVQIGVEGKVDEQLTQGSFLEIDVFFLGVKIYDETVGFDQLLPLPVGPGPLAVNYSVSIPGEAPPGLYLVQLTFYDQSNTQIQCITLQFPL
jgi:hypothetical protein